MKIRIANFGDIEAIKTLCEALYGEMAALKPQYFQKAAANEEALLAAIERPKEDILVLEEEEELLGLLRLKVAEHACPSFLVPHTKALVVEFFVRREARRKGHGQRLLEAAKVWASINGAKYLLFLGPVQSKDAPAFFAAQNVEAVCGIMGVKV
jgi:GNAT superfamily N-acetyltransferase